MLSGLDLLHGCSVHGIMSEIYLFKVAVMSIVIIIIVFKHLLRIERRGRGEGEGQRSVRLDGWAGLARIGAKKVCINSPLLVRVIAYSAYTSLDCYPACRSYHCTFCHT